MNIDYEDIQSFKKLNLPEILKSYGIELKPKGQSSSMALCPFHDDKEPSLSLSQKDDVWLWHCFGCRKGGTVIDFVRQKENLSVRDVYEKLKQKLPQPSGSTTKASADLSSGHSSLGRNGSHKPNPLELLKSVTDFYHKTFFEDKRGFEYLRARGIKSEETIRSFKVGFVSGQLKRTLSHSSPMITSLKNLGILNDEGNEFFYNSVVVPLLDDDGNVTGLYGRNISQKRHLYLKGPHKGLVNRQAAFDTQKIILTEAVLDTLSLYELGVRSSIPCYGTGGFTDDHRNLLEMRGIKEVELCFDNDDAGTRGAQELAKKLFIPCSTVKLPEGVKDANDFLVGKGTKEVFQTLERIAIEIPKTLFEAVACEIQKEKNALHLKIKDRSYRVLLPEYDSIHSLRVNVRLQVGESYHIDVLDLYSERQRKSYARKIEEKFASSENEVERDLYRILEELEKNKTEVHAVEEKPKPMSEEEKETALSSLKNPRLVQEILGDLEKLGCVGEETSKLLGYIVTLSRKLAEPLSMIIVSQSGAGKSNLADTLETCVPPEESVHLSRITPQALYYMEKEALKRKVLLIEEKEGSRDADYSIRVLQSKKLLTLAVPMKDPKDGKLKTQTFKVEGPVVVIETTTRTDLNPENTSRCFIIYLDESEEQTKKIHAFQRKQKTLEGQRQKKDTAGLVQKHQNLQRLLKPLAVHIPFVDELKFPSKWMRTRRDYQKFLNLIEAVAFLHQYQRELRSTDGVEYIEATLKDYEIAYGLSKEIFGDLLSELKKPEIDFLDELKRMAEDLKLRRFTCRMAREHTCLPDHLVRRYLETLHRMEYLWLLEGKNGVRFEYEINPEPFNARVIIQGLTTPAELKAHLLTSGREPFMKVNSSKSNGLALPFELLGKT